MAIPVDQISRSQLNHSEYWFLRNCTKEQSIAYRSMDCCVRRKILTLYYNGEWGPADKYRHPEIPPVLFLDNNAA
jgi:hypothetical protein